MASSSARLCSDEELQKAKEDLAELLAQTTILDAGDDDDEYSSSSDDEDDEANEGLETKKKATMEEIQNFLSLDFSSRKLPEDSDEAARLRELRSGEKGTLARVGDVLCRHFQDRMRAFQEKLREKVESGAYSHYDEATIDEQEQEDASSASSTAIGALDDAGKGESLVFF